MNIGLYISPKNPAVAAKLASITNPIAFEKISKWLFPVIFKANLLISFKPIAVDIKNNRDVSIICKIIIRSVENPKDNT